MPSVIEAKAAPFLEYWGLPPSLVTVSKRNAPPPLIVQVIEVTGEDEDVVVSAPESVMRDGPTTPMIPANILDPRQ
ncbi:MAG: hypothetical protein ABL932_20840 [Terricaulis sp.]